MSRMLRVFIALMIVTRLCTPASANVNLAFRVADGWEADFPSYPVYVSLLAGCAVLTFFAAEVGLRRIFS